MRGYTETSQAAPCEETESGGKVLKTWQSGTQLTDSHPAGQAIVVCVFLDRLVPVIFCGIRSSSGVLRKVNVASLRIEKPGLNRSPTKTESRDKGTLPSHPQVPSFPVFL